MGFDPNNEVIKLCAKGMELEGHGKPEEANKLFMQAWNEAASDFEKFTSAHYVARHQKSVLDKLHWDELSLAHALKINDDSIKSSLPSLYLNIAKCHEDLQNFQSARLNFELANTFSQHLRDDEYAKMVKRGILNGIERVTKLRNSLED